VLLADSIGQSGCGRTGAWGAACSPAAESAKADFVKFQRRIHSLTGADTAITRLDPQIRNPQSAIRNPQSAIRNPQIRKSVIHSGPTLGGIHSPADGTLGRADGMPLPRRQATPGAPVIGADQTSDTRNPHAPTDFRRRVRGIGGG
jgi:hypothetical protein